jgi:molybdopterin-guanine dinucleotide biosynthesis protein A
MTAPRESRAGLRPAPGAAQGSVVGLVLCGGESSRMGFDKALARLDGRPLVERAAARLARLAPRVLLATGRRPRYGRLGLEAVLDPVPGAGPLSGLVAGLERAAELGARHVVVLACDLPWADETFLAALLERARAEDLDACLLAVEGGLEPAYGVYSVRCAEPARRSLEAGERKLTAFHARPLAGRGLRLGTLSPQGAERAPARPTAFNVNTPADLERARRDSAGEDGP